MDISFSSDISGFEDFLGFFFINNFTKNLVICIFLLFAAKTLSQLEKFKLQI